MININPRKKWFAGTYLCIRLRVEHKINKRLVKYCAKHKVSKQDLLIKLLLKELDLNEIK